jgi:uncharacterized repeat protein (TIGR03803 family)
MRPSQLLAPSAVILAALFSFSASAHAANPHITSVTQIWARPYQTIQIAGTGFGTNRDLGDSQFFQLEDVTQNWSAGHTGDAVTLSISTWTDSLITITYFGGAYGTGNLFLNGGDVVSIKVWNPKTGAGPAKAQVTVLANLTPLFYFPQGSGADGTPIMDDQGNFYFVGGGGPNLCNTYYACGEIDELSPTSSGGYNLTVLYDFVGGSQGWGPQGTLVRDSAGNLYGTAANGGDSSLCFEGFGCGVVFEISNGVETVLHTFTANGDGITPTSGLIMDASGNLYGTTAGGGAKNYGTVYELSPNGSGGFNYAVIYSFQGAAVRDGASPHSPLTLDSQGNLYGSTAAGGADDPYCYYYGLGCGSVYELSPSGSGTFTEKVLYAFRGTANGVYATYGVTFDDSGNLYGVTFNGGPPCSNRNSGGCGVVYMLTPQERGQWTETTLYTFASDVNNVDGSNYPRGALTYYNGLLYGFASGGASQTGTFYSIAPSVAGSLQTIYSYGGGYDGGSPVGQPFIGIDGTLYGAAYAAIDILPLTPPKGSAGSPRLH